MSIAVGIPISRYFDWRTVQSIVSVIINDCMKTRHLPTFITRGNHERFMAIEKARCQIAQDVVMGGFDYLLFMDSDATLAPGTLERLLSWNVPIVSALCFKRREIVTPAFQLDKFDAETFNPYRSAEVDKVAEWIGKYGQLNTSTEVMLPTTPDGSLLEVDRVGTHCLLIHRDVLEAVPEPRFERITPENSGATGSDYDFCNKARRAGFKIYVDLSVIAGHLDGSHILSGMDFMMGAMYLNAMRKQFGLGG